MIKKQNKTKKKKQILNKIKRDLSTSIQILINNNIPTMSNCLLLAMGMLINNYSQGGGEQR